MQNKIKIKIFLIHKINGKRVIDNSKIFKPQHHFMSSIGYFFINYLMKNRAALKLSISRW